MYKGTLKIVLIVRLIMIANPLMSWLLFRHYVVIGA